MAQSRESLYNPRVAPSLATCLFICLVVVLGALSVPQAAGYTFASLSVDFPSFKEDLFGCAATGRNDLEVTVGGCNDQSSNGGFRGFMYDGRRFAEVDFNHAKSAKVSDTDVQNATSLAAKSFYQATPLRRNTSGPVSHLSQRPVINFVTPQDINNQGEITGWFLDDTRLRGFVKRNGNVLAIDVPNSLFTEATGINNSGDVVGDYRSRDGAFHGFVYRNRAYTTLDVPSAGDTGAAGVNNLGQVVGCYSSCSRGFVYDPRTSHFSSIEFPGAVTTQVRDINDVGQLVGIYSLNNVDVHAFLYDSHGFLTIDAPGAALTAPFGINNLGQVVGYYVVQVAAGVFEHHAYIAKPQ
jgi:uncharacterized membrane protein